MPGARCVHGGAMTRLHCSRCGTSVSTEFIPIATDTPDQGLIVRAWVECPKCIRAEDAFHALGRKQVLRADRALALLRTLRDWYRSPPGEEDARQLTAWLAEIDALLEEE